MPRAVSLRSLMSKIHRVVVGIGAFFFITVSYSTLDTTLGIRHDLLTRDDVDRHHGGLAFGVLPSKAAVDILARTCLTGDVGKTWSRGVTALH